MNKEKDPLLPKGRDVSEDITEPCWVTEDLGGRPEQISVPVTLITYETIADAKHLWETLTVLIASNRPEEEIVDAIQEKIADAERRGRIVGAGTVRVPALDTSYAGITPEER